MRKLAHFSLMILFLFISCAKNIKTELTVEQKTAIVAEVEKVHDDLIANLSKLDIDIWTEPWWKSRCSRPLLAGEG